ncbi:hypothetical protein MT355_12020 [Rathayibacter sp. VKM Ac-2929]|uniref:hypothetical protein n=1 Tax=Rathayibacter sp. VKM Ac-2929 TaxID=2929480 RepID=UPI001FB384BA|nr:hypothetical protein [Rathayibacter sp. VKM Ac-2929]MCJ1673983.1 hypothetical protein [Rathayibacter sp. VKM Ac-2929]
MSHLPRALAVLASLALALGAAVVPAVPAAAQDLADPGSRAAVEHDAPPPQRSVPTPSAARAVAAPPANDALAAATVIASVPFSTTTAPYYGATLEPDEPVVCRTTDGDHTDYETAATGSVWFSYTATARQTLTIGGDVGGKYTLVNAYPTAPMSELSRVSCAETEFRDVNHLQVEAGRTYYFQVGLGFGDYSGEYSPATPEDRVRLTITPSAPVAGTTTASAVPVTSLPAAIAGSNTRVDFNWYYPYDACSDAEALRGTVWYRFRAAADQTVQVDLRESYVGAAFAVYESDGTNPSFEVTCVSSGSVDGPTSEPLATFTARRGVTYFIQVASATSQKGDWVLRLSDPTALTAGTPTFSGNLVVGQGVTANPGAWGPQPLTLAYQWNRNGTPIAGATSAYYVPKAEDAGKALTVTVTGSKAGYTSTSRTSAASTVASGALIQTPTPTVSGTATAGSTLTAAPGTWDSGVVLSYQWKRNGTTAITGATAKTYVIQSADAGAGLSVSVTGTKPGYTVVTKTSAAVSVKAALQTLMPTPTITGTKTVGATLTANAGTWDAGTTLTYQWKKNGGTYISGATAKTYVLKASDAGATITVSVTSTKPGYSPATKTSATTAAVAKGTLAGPVPTITGTAKVGQTLTAKPGTWAPAPVALTYQWYRGSTAISGATTATYKLATADKAGSITVKVTGTKTGYTTLTKTSTAVKPS